MKTRLFLLLALSLVLISCEDKNDEPWSPQTQDVKIVALSGSTIYSMNTADGQLKTTSIGDSYGTLENLFLHNGEMMLFSKASDGYRMMKFDGDNITGNNIVTLLNDYLGGPWWVDVTSSGNNYFYACSNREKYVILDENGNSREYNYALDNSHPYYSLATVNGNGNFYQAYIYFQSSTPEDDYWVVKKNGQEIYQVSGIKVEPIHTNINAIGDNVYLLGSNYDDKGVYAMNSNAVVDDHFTVINCACVINGQLCLGGYKTDEHKVNRATMKVGDKYYDLTDELGWYEYKDAETGAGNNHSSCVESFMVENNEIYVRVRKYSQVNPYISGGYDYFNASGDAIFRNTHKVMDLGDKLIRSCVIIPQK